MSVAFDGSKSLVGNSLWVVRIPPVFWVPHICYSSFIDMLLLAYIPIACQRLPPCSYRLLFCSNPCTPVSVRIDQWNRVE